VDVARSSALCIDFQQLDLGPMNEKTAETLAFTAHGSMTSLNARSYSGCARAQLRQRKSVMRESERANNLERFRKAPLVYSVKACTTGNPTGTECSKPSRNAQKDELSLRAKI
jgi:hypothetical protein